MNAMMANFAKMMEKGVAISEEERIKADTEARKSKERVWIKENLCDKTSVLQAPGCTTLIMSITSSVLTTPAGKKTTKFNIALRDPKIHPDDWSECYEATNVNFEFRSGNPTADFRFTDARSNDFRVTLTFCANGVITGQQSGANNGLIFGAPAMNIDLSNLS